MNRSAITASKRVVIKVGSSTLTGSAGQGLNSDAIAALVDVIATLRQSGKEVVLVSSGAIAASFSVLGLTSRPKDLASQQACASVGQGILIAAYNHEFSKHKIISSQVLLTIDDVVRRSHYQNAQRTLLKLLQMGVVPIINENDTVGVQEIRFGDNDRIAALIAHLIGADVLALVTDVDGLYDAPPHHEGARRISEVHDVNRMGDIEIGGVGSSGVGSGGMVTKIEAARIATSAGVSMLLTTLPQLVDALAGKDVGTIFHPVKEHKPSRLLWLAHAATPHGKLVLDAGATTAIRERGTSLLPIGVTSVVGEFIAGDTVELISPTGEVIARGLVAFDSAEIPALLGRTTKELGQALGPEYERELVHRDDLVLL